MNVKSFFKGFAVRFQRLAADESGQALVEFALVMIPLMLLILGMVDFARLFQQYQMITDAAREGARIAVVADLNPSATQTSPEPTDRTTAVVEAIRGTLTAAGVEGAESIGAPTESCGALPGEPVSAVQIYSCRWNGARGEAARVAIRAPYRFIILGPFIGWATGEQTITLSTFSVMRKE